MNSQTQILLAAAVAASLSGPAQGQLRPPAAGGAFGEYSMHDFASKWMMQQDDIPEINHHAEANKALENDPDKRPRIVMFGDSITAHWDLAAQDNAKRRFVNRGIGGQNSSQMLLRFEDDVVALRPNVVAILAGTNDLRAYVGDPAGVGPGALLRIARNITAMSDIADARGIAVVLATLPPVGVDREKVARDAHAINVANKWIADFAASRGYPVADYHRALVNEAAALPLELSEDGIHPNSIAYARMWMSLSAAIARARPHSFSK